MLNVFEQFKVNALIGSLFHFLLFISLSSPNAQPTWEGCQNITDADFTYTEVVNQDVDSELEEPIQMVFQAASGGTDIFFTQRGGKIRHYIAASQTVVTIGELAVYNEVEQGLTGIVLDPDFTSNGFMYLFYVPLDTEVFRISRFQFTGGTLNMDEEKVILEIPAQRTTCCHTGGAMAFDARGNLWISVGENANHPNEDDQDKSNEYTSANTASLKGSLLRITLDENDPRGYTIPAGNFAEHYQKYYADLGEDSIAALYENPDLVRPELYAKGLRNAYAFTVDPHREWAAWGGFGPNTSAATEEYDLITKPEFAGWPYWSGDNHKLRQNSDPQVPINDSKWNTGLRQLPPAKPAIYAYTASGAIGGPFYYYDGELDSPTKFPPHFNQAWFVTDWHASDAIIFEVSEDGSEILQEHRMFDFGFVRPLEMEFGPEGSLYVINYAGWFNSSPATSIARIDYNGNCHPDTPVPPLTTRLHPRGGFVAYSLIPKGVLVKATGNVQVDVRDLKGRLVQTLNGFGPVRVNFSIPSMYVLTVTHGDVVRRFKVPGF